MANPKRIKVLRDRHLSTTAIYPKTIEQALPSGVQPVTPEPETYVPTGDEPVATYITIGDTVYQVGGGGSRYKHHITYYAIIPIENVQDYTHDIIMFTLTIENNSATAYTYSTFRTYLSSILPNQPTSQLNTKGIECSGFITDAVNDKIYPIVSIAKYQTTIGAITGVISKQVGLTSGHYKVTSLQETFTISGDTYNTLYDNVEEI